MKQGSRKSAKSCWPGGVERFHKGKCPGLLPGISREELQGQPGGLCARKHSPRRFRCCWSKEKITLPGEFIKKAGTEITLAPEELRAQRADYTSVCEGGARGAFG